VDKLGALEMINVNYMPISQEEIVEIKLQFDAACTFVPENVTLNTTVTVAEGKVNIFVKIHLHKENSS
jgi:hypothetical protein